jgi:putative ABC transport system permease protein
MNSLVFSNMLHRPMRTLVSVVGIGTGILLIVFTIGLTNGTMRERAERDANVGAEILFRASGDIGLSADALRLPADMENDLEKVDGVATAVPIAQNTVAATDAATGNRLIDGVDFDKYAAVAGLQIVTGRQFVEGRDEMMVDTAWFARRKAKIGDRFKIYERDFEIVGVYEPSAGGRIKIPLTTMQEQLGSEGKVSGFLVKIKDGYTQEQVGDNLFASFPDSQIIRTSELEELYMQGIPALNVFLDVVVWVAGVISALIILLTMYTTVTERTRQIGVLKSLGMSKAGVALTIIKEALLISLAGIVFGVGATFVLKFVLAKWTTLTVQIDPELILKILAVGALSGVIGALYPGLRAANLDAVDALNYD